jgi:hypothetical protein
MAPTLLQHSFIDIRVINRTGKAICHVAEKEPWNWCMRLFDEYEREDLNYASEGEADFKFLNRTALPAFVRTRNQLETWFSEYPQPEKKEFLSRFRSNDHNSFDSSFFELLIYIVFTRMGFSLTAHHHVSRKRIDFLASRQGFDDFYIEATVSFRSETEQNRSKKESVIIDYINRNLVLKDTFIEYECIQSGKNMPSSARLVYQIHKWDESVSRETLLALSKSEKWNDLPSIEIADNEWRFKFTLFPRDAHRTGSKPIGMRFSGVVSVDSVTPLYNTLALKAKKYGKLHKPYLIAVNSLSSFFSEPDSTDIFEVLLGKEKHSINLATGEQKFARDPNGLWVGPRRPRNRNIGGILFFNSLKPWTVTKSSNVLIYNPWAKIRLDQRIWTGSKYISYPKESEFKRTAGKSLSDILCLCTSWPFDIQSGGASGLDVT